MMLVRSRSTAQLHAQVYGINLIRLRQEGRDEVQVQVESVHVPIPSQYLGLSWGSELKSKKSEPAIIARMGPESSYYLLSRASEI